MGLSFETFETQIDETLDPSWDIDDAVRELAFAKGTACKCQLKRRGITNALPILSADTLVSVDQRILGKPTNKQHARSMLNHLSGRKHQVYTAVSLLSSSKVDIKIVTAEVVMRRILAEEIENYCLSGEPFDKAGSYGLQGIGAIFVDQVIGQPSTVVGLPMKETEEMLRNCGVNTWQYRRMIGLN